MENGWARLDSNQRPKDYESAKARKQEHSTTHISNTISGLVVVGCFQLFRVLACQCAKSVPSVRSLGPTPGPTDGGQFAGESPSELRRTAYPLLDAR